MTVSPRTMALLAAALLMGLAGLGAPWLYGARKMAELSRAPDLRFSGDNAAIRASARSVDVVLIGDSRVARWTPSPGPRTVMRGIGGETTAQTAQRLDDDALSLKPRAVLIMVGVNDLVAASYMAPELGSRAAALVARRLEEMADRVAQAGACAIVATIEPPTRPGLARRIVWRAQVMDDVARVNRQIRAMASPRLRVLDVAALLPVDGDGYLLASHAVDTLHLNAAAYGAINSSLTGLLPPSSALAGC